MSLLNLYHKIELLHYKHNLNLITILSFTKCFKKFKSFKQINFNLMFQIIFLHNDLFFLATAYLYYYLKYN